MRVAAGVILIIAAIFNLLAALLYLGGGAATTAVSSHAESAYSQSQDLTDEQRSELERARDEVGATGIGFMAFGVFLLVSVGILIAGAVFLFQDVKPGFIMVAGLMAIIAEVIGALVTSNFGVTNIIGVVGGLLAIIAAKSMSGAVAPPPAVE